MGTINFTKMNGAGNDFILIDAQKNKNTKINPVLIQKMCDRRKGIGADGILIIDSSLSYDYKLKYYNSDGSLGSLCGNGARCSIKYFIDIYGIDNNVLKFECNNQIYMGKVEKNQLITFYLNEPYDLKLKIVLKLENSEFPIHFINTGSPHAVIFWENYNYNVQDNFFNFNMIKFGKQIRYSKEFQPEGTNVNVICSENGQNYIRTYERGVEDETLACGTGTVAAAIITYLLKKNQPPHIFNTYGNDQLIVNFEVNNDKFSKITLTGPVKINYIGSYNF